MNIYTQLNDTLLSMYNSSMQEYLDKDFDVSIITRWIKKYNAWGGKPLHFSDEQLRKLGKIKNDQSGKQEESVSVPDAGKQEKQYHWVLELLDKHTDKVQLQNRVPKIESHTHADGTTDNHAACLYLEHCFNESAHSGGTTGNTACKIVVYSDGTLAYICNHAHCENLGWKDFRNYLEPGIYEQPQYKLSYFTDNKGNRHVEKTVTNCAIILENDKNLQGKIRLNEFNFAIELTGQNWKKYEDSVTGADEAFLTSYIEQNYHIHFSAEMLMQGLLIAANNHPYHPVRDLLNGLRWDGQKRLEYILRHFFGVPDNIYTRSVSQLMFFGIIHRVFTPGCKFDYVPVLIGEQGCGKTEFCTMLALDDKYFCNSLNDLRDVKQTGEVINGSLVVELGEMLAMQSAKSIEQVKSFVTRRSDRFRVSYGHGMAKDYWRQCIFVGTSNDPECLPADLTGNRRFLPIVCNPEENDLHPLQDREHTRNYITQCYAEAMELYRNGKSFLILPKEAADIAAEMAKKATPEHPWQAKIQNYLDGLVERQTYEVCVAQVLNLLDIPDERVKQSDRRLIVSIITHSDGWHWHEPKDSKRTFEGYGKQRYFEYRNNSEPDFDIPF